MYCQQCGALNPDNAIYCSQCGAPLMPGARHQNMEPLSWPMSGADPMDSDEPPPEVEQFIRPAT